MGSGLFLFESFRLPKIAFSTPKIRFPLVLVDPKVYNIRSYICDRQLAPDMTLTYRNR